MNEIVKRSIVCKFIDDQTHEAGYCGLHPHPYPL